MSIADIHYVRSIILSGEVRRDDSGLLLQAIGVGGMDYYITRTLNSNLT